MTHQILNRLPARIVIAIAVFLVSACSVIPVESRPNLELPSKFTESAADLSSGENLGHWKPAEPTGQQKPSPWWNVFGDPILVQLEEEALLANPDVSVAISRLKQARALTSQSEAARYPDIGVGFGPTRQRNTGVTPGNSDGTPGSSLTLWRAQAYVAYEADIFGRVSSGVVAAHADADQQQALAHQLLLLVQTDVARTYFSLRQLVSERHLLQQTVQLRVENVELLDKKLSAGAIAQFVSDQAKAELFSTKADLQSVDWQLALTKHALATLLGQFSISPKLEILQLTDVTIRLPTGMPSSLLERRPDIAAAERAMAAENARIGIAKAAYFPSISLTGNLGFESADLDDLFNWSHRAFLFGPLLGTALKMPIFDGGRRKAEEARARALYEERVADYRKTVLQAFREVEDSLVSLRTSDERIINQREAELASSRVARSARVRFDQGDVDYLMVVDAERTLLRNRQLLVQSQGERARSTVDLVRALGGGWKVTSAKNG
jgi:outer membrane protein, multidrug efflux system